MKSHSDNILWNPRHPSSMYNKKFQSNMKVKLADNDRVWSLFRKHFLPNHEPCTFGESIYDSNSAAYKLMQEAYLAGCRLGYANAIERIMAELNCNDREEAKSHFGRSGWFAAVENVMDKLGLSFEAAAIRRRRLERFGSS